MAVVKMSSNGKSVQFVDDYGNLYITSKSFLVTFLYGSGGGAPLLLTRLPNRVAPGRFKISPLWDVASGEKVDMVEPPGFESGVRLGDDALSAKVVVNSEDKKMYGKRLVL